MRLRWNNQEASQFLVIYRNFSEDRQQRPLSSHLPNLPFHLLQISPWATPGHVSTSLESSTFAYVLSEKLFFGGFCIFPHPPNPQATNRRCCSHQWPQQIWVIPTRFLHSHKPCKLSTNDHINIQMENEEICSPCDAVSVPHQFPHSSVKAGALPDLNITAGFWGTGGPLEAFCILILGKKNYSLILIFVT